MKNKHSTQRCRTALSALLLLLALPAEAAAWQPQGDVDFIVPSSPGGGSDLNARTIADIIRKENLVPTNINVINKPGGSGAVAFSYINSKKGRSDNLMILHSGQDLGSYVLNWGVKGKDLTYLATVAYDDLMICAVAGSEYTDIKKLIADSKTKRITYGGSQRGNGDHLSFLMLNKITGSNFKYVMFNSAGEVTSAMLGGHVNIGIFNPSECIAQARAGKFVPLATFSSQKLPGEFANVPTFQQLGYPDLVLREVRAIAGPPNMPAEAVKYYETVLQEVTTTPQWRDEYIQKNFLTPVFLGAEATRSYFTKASPVAAERIKADKLTTNK
jgi:putative tricarboxylic transport membrane protein